jgi:hypothetical protein
MRACTVPSRDLRVSSVSFWSVDRATQQASQGAHRAGRLSMQRATEAYFAGITLLE